MDMNITMESKRQYCYDCNLAMPSVENVMVASLYIAIYLGYKTVELYGVEHSWTKSLYVNDHNQVCLHDDHFMIKKKFLIEFSQNQMVAILKHMKYLKCILVCLNRIGK